MPEKIAALREELTLSYIETYFRYFVNVTDLTIRDVEDAKVTIEFSAAIQPIATIVKQWKFVGRFETINGQLYLHDVLPLIES
jgi:hypothetical protein